VSESPPPRTQPADAVDDLAPAERRCAFLARLQRMSPEERLRAARYEFDRWQRAVWAGRYPDEVPTVNGEVEWLALGLADVATR
jgi:hypothetical protein